MPIRYKVNCQTCRLSRNNPKLRKRIQDAFYDREAYGESIGQISDELQVNRAAMYNHVKKHVTRTPIKTPLTVERNVAKMKAGIFKDAELALEHEKILPQKDYEQALTTVLAEGMAQLKKGGKHISVSQLLTAAKIKGDLDSKKRGQDTELLKMMMRSASGIPEGVVSGTPAESPELG